MRSTHLKNTVVNIIHTIILMCTFTGEIRNIIKTIRDGNVIVNEFNQRLCSTDSTSIQHFMISKSITKPLKSIH